MADPRRSTIEDVLDRYDAKLEADRVRETQREAERRGVIVRFEEVVDSIALPVFAEYAELLHARGHAGKCERKPGDSAAAEPRGGSVRLLATPKSPDAERNRAPSMSLVLECRGAGVALIAQNVSVQGVPQKVDRPVDLEKVTEEFLRAEIRELLVRTFGV